MKRTTSNRVIFNVVKGIKFASSALLASVLLASCATFIPDQEVADPFGLDSQVVPIPFKGRDLGNLAVDGSVQSWFEINDFDTSLPVKPTRITNVLRVASASLDDPNGPEQLTLSDVRLDLKIWEGAGGYASASRKASTSLESAATLVLVNRGCSANSCSYAVSAGSELGALTLQGNDLAAFLDIMTGGTPTNRGEVGLSLVGNPDQLAGHVLTIILDAKEGHISFK